MEQKTLSDVDVIMAGLGGMGVLTAGQLLSRAALKIYKHVSYVPSYDTFRRGGLCECTVVLSDNEIDSPLLDQAQTVLTFAGSQVKAFESRVQPGGIMIVESAGLVDKPDRKDFKMLPFSGLDIAISMGDSIINNLILLGVYVELTKPIPAELVEEELDRKYSGGGERLKRNKAAFKRGLELARDIES